MKKLILLIGLIYSCSGPNEVSEIDAITDAQIFIEKQLKSPSTAEFSDVQADMYSGTEYKVKGSVDSQNSFGAMVRTNFECTVKYQDEYSRTHTVKDVKIQ